MDWRKLEAHVDGVQKRSWGETVRLSFMAGATLDPDRPAADIRAILHTGGNDSAFPGDGNSMRYRMRLLAGQAELHIDASTYEGPAPRVGDRVRATDRTGQPWWEVRGVSDRYSNPLVLSLSQL